MERKARVRTLTGVTGASVQKDTPLMVTKGHRVQVSADMHSSPPSPLLFS